MLYLKPREGPTHPTTTVVVVDRKREVEGGREVGYGVLIHFLYSTAVSAWQTNLPNPIRYIYIVGWVRVPHADVPTNYVNPKYQNFPRKHFAKKQRMAEFQHSPKLT